MRKKFLKNSILLPTLWFALSAAPAFGQQTILHFKSDPGDFIGLGQEVTLTTDEVDFFAFSNFGNSVHFFIHNFSRPLPPEFIFWSADFAPPQGMELVEGVYENATRWPFQDPTDPGLSFSGQGRGCNTLTGRFEVLEAIYDPVTGNVINFAVDFEQHCEGGIPALLGFLRFNSFVPLPVLIPPKISLLNDLNNDRCIEATGADGVIVSLSGSSRSEIPFDLLWSTSNGDSGFGSEFSFQLGVDQSADVTLSIKDPVTGNQASSSLRVCVSDTTPPRVRILAPQEGAIFLGENARLNVQVSDAVDQGINHYRLSAGSSANVRLDVSTGTSSIMLFRKAKGEVIETKITVEAQDFSGNVGAATVTVFKAHDMNLIK